jgi:hypothetical protein
MKARKLKALLNNTGYAVMNKEDRICIGSSLCSDLITVNKKTLKINYALDRDGRKNLESRGRDELVFIWDKLQELIDNGEIKDIIEGVDVIENPIVVFTVDDGKLISTTTDKTGWPNVTAEGDMMYDNTYFRSKKEAIKYGIAEYTAGLKNSLEWLRDKTKALNEINDRIDMYEKYIENLSKN